MKKFIYAFVAVAATVTMLASCSNPSHEETPATEGTKITKLIEADKAHMDSIDTAYLYFETTFTFAGTVDTLTTPDIVNVSNVFETVDKPKMTPTVYFAEHSLGTTDSTKWTVKEGSFWLEDLNLRDFKYSVSVEDAFNILLKTNVVKPKSKYCVLRAQLGPVECNPQFIFGNDKTGVVFVDALTGKVSTMNPAFGNGTKLTSLE